MTPLVLRAESTRARPAAERLRARPQRLLDVDRRARRRPHGERAAAARCAGPGPRSGASSPNSTASGRAASATTIWPGGQRRRRSPAPSRSPGVRERAAPSGPSTRGGVERPDRHARLDEREQQRVVEQAAAAEAALHAAARAPPPRPACGSRRGRGRRGGRRRGRPRDRLAAQLDGARAAEARREHREALAAPAGCGAAARAPAPRSESTAARGTRRAAPRRPSPARCGASSLTRRPPSPGPSARGRELAQPRGELASSSSPSVVPGRGRRVGRGRAAGRPRRRRGWPGPPSRS